MEKGHLFWNFSKNFSLRVEAPTCLGHFTNEDALLREATLVQGEAGSYEEGNKVIFFWLIDKTGVVLDALFSAFGDSILIGCAECICEKSIGKSFERACHITKSELEAFLSDGKKELPGRVKRRISLVLEARDAACSSLPQYQEQKECHPEWETLSKEERLTLIRRVIEEYVLPYLQKDNGGIEILDLIDGYKVQVAFQGACLDCMGSSGSTFAYIQHLLKNKVQASLEIVQEENIKYIQKQPG